MGDPCVDGNIAVTLIDQQSQLFDAARYNMPDVILLDMMLPKMSGLDVLRALKADVLLKHIPVIVVSGLGQGNEAKLLKEGAKAFLMKSQESFENNSLALIEALQGLLTGSKA